MKRVRGAVLLLIVFISFHSFLFAEPGYDRKLIVAGEIDYPPYSFYNNRGEPDGFNVEITRAVARIMNMDVHIILKPWEQVRKDLELGKIDAVQGMYYTPERAKKFIFSTPFSVISEDIFMKDNSYYPESIEDLRGKEIVVMTGDVMHDYILENSITDRIIPAATVEEAMGLFASGKGDYVLAAKIPGLYWINKHHYEDIITDGIPVKNYMNCFAAAKDNPELLMQFSEGLNILNQTGEYRRIYNKWFGLFEGELYPRQLIINYSLAVFIPLIGIILFLFFFARILKVKVNKATGEIRQRESALRSYIDNAPDGVFIADENGCYVEVNPAAISMTGYSQSELLSKSISDILPPESLDEGLNHFRELKEKGWGQKDLMFLHKSGEKRWWSLYAVKLSETRYLGFTKDITENRTSEQRILNLLAEKELLLKEVHHRIKNNMNTIKGLLTLQILSENNPHVVSSLKGAESRVNSMIMLYDRLYSTDNYREMSVKDYLESLIDDIAGSCPVKADVEIKTDLDDFILNVKFLSPLGIIINELITNSMKYAFQGKDSGLIIVSAGQKDTGVEVSVKDNGSGIPESVDFGTSTGFGLDLVKMLAEQLDGTVDIIRDKGTEIIIRFDAE